jgi:hypothetical protein
LKRLKLSRVDFF